MTRQQMNDIFRDAFNAEAAQSLDFVDRAADAFKDWLHGKIDLAQQSLQTQQTEQAAGGNEEERK